MAVVSVKKTIGQAFSPLVRFDYKLHGISDKRQNSDDLDEMQKSTRQLTLSSGQVLSPLVRIDYELHGDKISKPLMRYKSPLDILLCQMDKHFLHSHDLHIDSTRNYTGYMTRDNDF